MPVLVPSQIQSIKHQANDAIALYINGVKWWPIDISPHSLDIEADEEKTLEPAVALPASGVVSNVVNGDEYTAYIGINNPTYPITTKVTAGDGTVVADADFDETDAIRDENTNAFVDGGSPDYLDYGFNPMVGETPFTVEISGAGEVYFFSVFVQ